MKDRVKQNCIFSVPSSPPTVITANNTSSTAVIVTWQPLAKEHRNGLLLGYKVFSKSIIQHARRRRSVELQSQVAANTTSIEIQYLLKYTIYCIRVLAYNRVGDGNISECVMVRTAEDGKIPGDSLVIYYCFSATARQNNVIGALPRNTIIQHGDTFWSV